jgi:hypothetical protein
MNEEKENMESSSLFLNARNCCKWDPPITHNSRKAGVCKGCHNPKVKHS